MLLINLIQNKIVKLACCALGTLVVMGTLQAQENTPFSRFGLGEPFPYKPTSQNALGGMTAANNGDLTINSANPASYGLLYSRSNGSGGTVIYELATMLDNRTLRNKATNKNHQSVNFTPAYFSMAMPLSSSGLGLAFGFRPMTRISYNILETDTSTSLHRSNYFSGNGGWNQIFVGAGKSFKNLRIGINAVYNFGKREANSIVRLASDSFSYLTTKKAGNLYYKGITWDMGLQYSLKLSEKRNENTKIRSTYYLDLGLAGAIKQTLNTQAARGYYITRGSNLSELIHTDTLDYISDNDGKLTLPSKWSAGVMLNHYLDGAKKLGLGIEYDVTNWGDYTNSFNLDNSNITPSAWMLRVGGYIVPNPLRGRTFWEHSKYALGGYMGKDYVTMNGHALDIQALTLGMSIYLKKFKDNSQVSLLNAAFEVGRRGHSNVAIQENFYKLHIGLSLTDIWLFKRKNY